MTPHLSLSIRRTFAIVAVTFVAGCASAPSPGKAVPEAAGQSEATRAAVAAPAPDQSAATLEVAVRAHAGPPAVSANLAFGPDTCDGRQLDHTFYVVCHVAAWRIPRWVVYHLTAADLVAAVPRHDAFRADADLLPGERAELSDYAGRPFDRGHMAPADDFRRSADAMNMTFLLSNMAPQRHSLNGGRWRVLESEVHTFAGTCGSIWVVTGPLFLNAAMAPVAPHTFIGSGHVAVPTHFFKAVLCERPDGQHTMYAFLMAHRKLPGPTLSYAVSVDRIEQLSGLDLFAELPDAEEGRLEAAVATVWPVSH